MESFIEIKKNRYEWRKEKKLRKKMRKDIINGLERLKNINKEKPKNDSLKELLKKGIERLKTIKHEKNEIKVAKSGPKWKVLRCTSCKAIQNRDHNATKNMIKIVESIYEGKGRPEKYKRTENN